MAVHLSWALDLDRGVERLITYEALLRSLFASAPATGLCLYDRAKMPLEVIDGALCTHPVVHDGRAYRLNPFYDAGFQSLAAADPLSVPSKLARLEAPRRMSRNQDGEPRRK